MVPTGAVTTFLLCRAGAATLVPSAGDGVGDLGQERGV